MQRQASETYRCAKSAVQFSSSIITVADKWMPQVFHVPPDLMITAGIRLNFQERERPWACIDAFQGREVGLSGLSLGLLIRGNWMI